MHFLSWRCCIKVVATSILQVHLSVFIYFYFIYYCVELHTEYSTQIYAESYRCIHYHNYLTCTYDIGIFKIRQRWLINNVFRKIIPQLYGRRQEGKRCVLRMVVWSVVSFLWLMCKLDLAIILELQYDYWLFCRT